MNEEVESYEDVTEQFVNNCKIALVPGELLHGNWFNLQYAMFAVEIMDPKLDARVKCNRKVHFIKEALDDGWLPLKPFTDASSLLGVLDEQLCSLVNWISGDLLVQTVYNSMYMHCTQLVEDPYIAAFCEGLRRSVFLIRRLIVTAGAFTEEDFVQSLYGMPVLGPDIRFDTKTCSQRVEQRNLFELRTTIQSPFEVIVADLEKVEAAVQSNDTFEEEQRYTISIRLRYIRLLMCIFQELDTLGEQFNDSLVDAMERLEISAAPSSVDLLAVLRNCQSFTEPLLATAHELMATMDAGMAPGPGKTQPRLYEYGIPGYEPMLNITRLPSSVPRSPQIVGRLDGFVFLSEQAQRIQVCLEALISLLQACETDGLVPFEELVGLMQRLNRVPARDIAHLERDVEKCPRLQAAGACILTRSILALAVRTLTAPGNRFQLQSFKAALAVVENAHLTALLDQFLAHPSNQQYQALFENCTLISVPTLSNYSWNRSRQRTALRDYLRVFLQPLVVWCNFDCALQSYCSAGRGQASTPGHLGFFMLHLYYNFAWDYLVSGFQLELYSGGELTLMYAFLSQLLRTASKFIQHYVLEAQQCRKAHLDQGLVGKKTKRKMQQLSRAEPFALGNLKRLTAEADLMAIHNLLALASLRAVLAVLADCNLDNFGRRARSDGADMAGTVDPFEVFARRVGDLVDAPYVLPSDQRGCTKALTYFADFIAGERNKNEGSAGLWRGAAELFRAADARIAEALARSREDEAAEGLAGSPDALEDLASLAKRNAVTCQLLSTCPQRRPNPNGVRQTPPNLRVFPYPQSPVQLHFDHLVSRCFPLLKLVQRK